MQILSVDYLPLNLGVLGSEKEALPIKRDHIQEDHTIRQLSKNVQERVLDYVGWFWDRTLGYPLKESEGEWIEWKIERFENLIQSLQKTITDYVKDKNLDIYQLLVPPQEESLEWIKKLYPIFLLSKKKFIEGSERLNQYYLKEVRRVFTEDFLQQLRLASEWVKDHADMPGVEHVDALCYLFYIGTDLNQCCYKVLETFIHLGKEALVDKDTVDFSEELHESRYELIRNLLSIHYYIQAAPIGAKSPVVKQLANSARGHLNGFMGMVAFDPNQQSNPVHILLEKTIKFLREGEESLDYAVKDIAMGSPTIEEGYGIAQINPEFLGFLRYCKRMGHTHFYINQQDYISKMWIKGNESPRCQALHHLAENEFKNVLFVITMSQNSAFYHQKGHEIKNNDVKTIKSTLISQLLNEDCKEIGCYLPPYLFQNSKLKNWMIQEMDHLHREQFNDCVTFDHEEIKELFIQKFHQCLHTYINKELVDYPIPESQILRYYVYKPSVDYFKQELIAQMFDLRPQETGNDIPKDLINRFNLREWSMQATDEIHKVLFKDSLELSIKERRIFIRLFYQNLMRKILIELKPNSYNTSCKDRIDRGAATDAEDFAYLAILANCANHPLVIKFFQMLIFARAIIVRKRTMIDERLERLIETVKFMLDHEEQLQKLHTILFPNIKITTDQFPLKESLDEEKKSS